MLLSDIEKKKFCEYLDIEASSSAQIASQMEKMGTPPLAELARRERNMAAACLMVAARLRSGETQEVR